jgi:hypothetical protein
MGGKGSSKWGTYERKRTVEQCYTIDITYYLHYGAFNYQSCEGYQRHVLPTYPDENYFDINFKFDTKSDEHSVMQLTYTLPASKDKVEVEQGIKLITSTPHYGGIRWWFECPLVIDGKHCGRRVGKLYLPPGAKYFGCRHCYDLTYRSSQRHNKTADVHFRTFERLRRQREVRKLMAETFPDKSNETE